MPVPVMNAFIPLLPLHTTRTTPSHRPHPRQPRRPRHTQGPASAFFYTTTTTTAAAATAATPPSSATPARVISSLENVSYDVGGVRILDDISLELRCGEIVAILGPSGSGKSTVLRILAGLLQPSRGRALYHGNPFVGPNPATSIVFQTFALYPWLTVLENVELGLASASPSATAAASGRQARELRRARALTAIDVIGLDGYENAYPRELSGGMRQRVGFARALAVEPELLCMDEPFSALDVLTAENLRTELLRLWQAGDVSTTSVLMITHSIEEAVTLADRIIILGRDPGHIRHVLTVRMHHPRNRKAPVFQAITDLVHTILSQHDYTISPEDIAMLNGDSTIAENYVDRARDFVVTAATSAPSSSAATTPTTSPVSPSVAGSTGSTFSTSSSSASSILTLDALSLSEPVRPVTLDLAPGSTDDTQTAPTTTTTTARYPQLPAVRIGSMSGLLSFIAEERVDLYLLGQRLQLDVDDLYPLIDAARILGLIDVDDGDVSINAKGLEFTQASIDQRKSMVRMSCLSAPGARLIAHIHRLLSQAKTKKLPQELFFDTVLLKHFLPVDARRQLEIAIEWGRFAELFGYEVLTGTLFLDTGDEPESS